MSTDTSQPAQPLILHFGQDELVIRKRYETLSIINDILIALWFIAGSILFFYASLTVIGTVCFLIGSIELLIRPLIRLVRQVHIGRVRTAAGGQGPMECPEDF